MEQKTGNGVDLWSVCHGLRRTGMPNQKCAGLSSSYLLARWV